MPKRALKPLTSPEAFGLLVSLLARYANDAPDRTELDGELERRIGDDSHTRSLAARLIRNFKDIPIEQRIRELGDLAELKVASFPEARFEAAIKALPVTNSNSVLFADDVAAVPLPPLSPFERISLNFSGIYCSEETGDQINLVGASDEAYVITNTVVLSPTGENVVRSETHPLGQGFFNDMDTGNARFGPIAACFFGKPTDISLVCTVMEHDEGDPDAFKDEIDLIVRTTFAVIGILAPGTKLIATLAAIEKLVIEAINWLIDTDDDIVETVTRVIDVDELRRIALTPERLFVGQHKVLVQPFPPTIETVSETTEILHHFATTHTGGGGKYNVCFRLKKSTVPGLASGSPSGGLLVPVLAEV